MFASAHDFPKFVKVGAAMSHQLRKVGTSVPIPKFFIPCGPSFTNFRIERTLELPFRSSHDIAATSDANFGIKGALATY
jgi:hypothetical protein